MSATGADGAERRTVGRATEPARHAVHVRGAVEARDHVGQEPRTFGVGDTSVIGVCREHVDIIDGRGQQLAHVLNVLCAPRPSGELSALRL